MSLLSAHSDSYAGKEKVLWNATLLSDPFPSRFPETHAPQGLKALVIKGVPFGTTKQLGEKVENEVNRSQFW
jgi:hypothetical protein